MFNTRKTVKSVMTGLLVAFMGATTAIAPAQAGGSFSLTILPSDPEHAQAMRAGMQIFQLINAMENGANVSQNGMNNSAGIDQSGYGNNGVIYQEGNGHEGTLKQNGYNNSYGLFQFGEGTTAHVNQGGFGQTGATFVFGF